MESKTIEVNGVEITAHSDGSVEWIHGKTKKPYRTFGYNHGGYRRVSFAGKEIYVHRIIAMVFCENWNDDLIVDHKNGIRGDNRPENIRTMKNQSEHMQAFSRKPENCTSKFRGVSEFKLANSTKWTSWICSNYKRHYVGLFDTEQAAAIAYDRKAEELGFDEQAFNRTHHPELLSLSGAY